MLAASQRAKAIIAEREVMNIATPEHRATFRAALEADGRYVRALTEMLNTLPTLEAFRRRAL